MHSLAEQQHRTSNRMLLHYGRTASHSLIRSAQVGPVGWQQSVQLWLPYSKDAASACYWCLVQARKSTRNVLKVMLTVSCCIARCLATSLASSLSVLCVAMCPAGCSTAGIASCSPPAEADILQCSSISACRRAARSSCRKQQQWLHSWARAAAATARAVPAGTAAATAIC